MDNLGRVSQAEYHAALANRNKREAEYCKRIVELEAALSAERARVIALVKALKPFADMAESYEGEPAAFVIASKGGTIVSVYDLRGAAAALRALGQQDTAVSAPVDTPPEDYNCPTCGGIINSRAYGIEGADCSCVNWEGPK